MRTPCPVGAPWRGVLSLAALATLAALAGCSSASPPDAAPDVAMDAAAGVDVDLLPDVQPEDVPPGTLSHQAAPVMLTAGQEIPSLCESFTLATQQTIYVNAVEFQATGGMHHSNWLWVPSTFFQGPDGTWPCAQRSFDQGVAAAVGGVLFAQTTQVSHETQQFQPGVAIPIPAGARIIGQVHMLNVTGAPLAVQFGLNLRTIPPDDVRVRLAGLYLEYGPLNLPPRTQSAVTTSCDLGTVHQQQLNRPVDFHMYYGLPHYHSLATSMRVDIVGGPRDGTPLFEAVNHYGEPAGRMMDPPVDLTGATGLKLTCVFNNTRDARVRYGIGDQEMCIFLGFTDSPIQWAASAPHNGVNTVGATVNGVTENTSPCTSVIALPAHGH